jgi:cysteine-rich repeat protein
MRRLLWLLLLVPVFGWGQGTRYHAPINTTGIPVNNTSAGGDESGIAWYADGSVWVGCAQNAGYFALNPDGTEINHCTTGNCGGCYNADCEGVTVVGDTLFCVGENKNGYAGVMASFDLGSWRAAGYIHDGLKQLHTYNTSTLLGSENTEGLAAVPYTCTDCESNVAFIVTKQDKSARVLTLAGSGADPRGYTDLSPVPSKFYPPCTNFSSCHDWSGLDFDPIQKYLYWSADGGISGCSAATKGLCIATLPTCSNDPGKTCISDAACSPGTCTATTQVAELHLATEDVNDGAYESLGVCPSCGYVGVAYDGAGFRTYHDSYCGDGRISRVETCDDGNQTAGDGCSATCLVEAGWKCSGAPSTCLSQR